MLVMTSTQYNSISQGPTDISKASPSSPGVGASVMKNCEPLVLGPALAALKSQPKDVTSARGGMTSARGSPSSHGVGASVMKNWEPLVLGPAFAMLRMPAPVCFSSGLISSSNLALESILNLDQSPYILELHSKIR